MIDPRHIGHRLPAFSVPVEARRLVPPDNVRAQLLLIVVAPV